MANCLHVWGFDRERRGRRAGMQCTVTRYVCATCGKRKYRASKTYPIVARLYRERLADRDARIVALEALVQSLRDSADATDAAFFSIVSRVPAPIGVN